MPGRCTPAAGLALLRVTQEAVTNARKHAPGGAVTITLTFGDDTATIVVDNTGVRVEPLIPVVSGGYGFERHARAPGARRWQRHSRPERGRVDSERRGARMKVLIVDDQTLIREGLVTICERLNDVEVVGTAADGEAALTAVADLQPDVVLMDLRMPRMDGVEATSLICERHPQTRVVVLTTYSDDSSILNALAAGALGYLTKDAGREDIHRALQAAARGQALLDPAVHARLTQIVKSQPGSSSEGALPDGLTVREAEVLSFIARGQSNQEIAATLFVTEATVKTHINRIFAKTQSRDRAQAVAYAHHHQLT